MRQKATTDYFIKKATNIHSNKYAYSKVRYIDCYTPICIICPIHGEFWQRPYIHLIGRGCPKCGLIHRNINRKTYGVGINDVDEMVVNTEYYKKWIVMLYRCYHPTQKIHSKSYNCVSVCDEWLYLSNFKKWFENAENGYRDGYELDKDLLIKGNKIYSPDTCCFIPSEINSIIKLRKKKRKYPIGVIKVSRGNKNYRADMKSKSRCSSTIGYYRTPEEAFNAYKIEKEKEIRKIATKYFKEDKITQKVYNALMNFSININD